MELEALGGFSGEVLDIGCALDGDRVYLPRTASTRTSHRRLLQRERNFTAG
jgi:hypothetical protein